MYHAIIDAASLENPTLLNEFEHVKVTVDHEPHSETSPYHFNFVLKIADDDIASAIEKLRSQMKTGWYAFSWSDANLRIIFKSKAFSIPLPDGWNSDEYREIQNFAKSHRISEEYRNFKKYFERVKDSV